MNNQPPEYPQTCPCRDCDRRHADCHGKCPAYAKFKEELERFNAYQRLQRYSNDLGRPLFKKPRRS